MILDEIVAHKRQELAEQRKVVPQEELEREILTRPAPMDLSAALRRREGPVRLIAEIKRASPSKGPLWTDLDPAKLAALYCQHGAAAISVLTEQRFFLGGEADLRAARAAVEETSLGARASCPPLAGETPAPPGRSLILRKDFIFDPYQVFEARAWGADALLLIVAILEDQHLRALLDLTHKLGMHALVETHDAGEVSRAVEAGARIVGVNNRDLRTFKVDLATTEALRPLIPTERVVVAESGIKGREDVRRLRRCGVDAILVGEALVTAQDVGASIADLFGEQP